MKRSLVALLAALPLIVGVTAAQADGFGFGGGGDDSSGGSQSQQVAVEGTVVSVDATAGTIVANASVAPADNQGDDNQGDDNDADEQSTGGSQGSQGPLGGHVGDNMDMPATTPATTQVTITTNSSTKIEVNGDSGTVANMTPGDKFSALFTGSSTDAITTIVSNPALEISDRTPEKQQHALYAFVGSVTGVDTTAGTVTVNVTRSLPSSLVPSGSSPVSFTVGTDTLILGGSNGLLGGALSDVSVGDIVAGGLFAPAGDTLAQVQTLPLRVLLDLPASSTSTSTAAQTARAKTKALRRAVALLDGKAKAKGKGKHKAKKHHARKH